MSPPLAATAVALATVAGGVTGALTRRWLGLLSRGARIPSPWCEAGTGAAWGVTVAAWGLGGIAGGVVGLLLGLGWLAVAGSAVDMTARRLPDALTLPAVPVVLVLLVPLGGVVVLRGVAGAVVVCGVHALVRLWVPSAMGGGDVKLAASVGAALAGVSWSAVVVGTVLAAVLTAVAGLALPAATGWSTAVADGPATAPHGPSMLLACLITVASAAAWPGPAGVG